MYQSLNTYVFRGTCVYQRMCLGKVLLFASVQVCLCCGCFTCMVFALVVISHLCLPVENMRPDCELAHRLINESFNGVSILGVTTRPDFGVGVVVFPRNISYNVKKYGTRALSKVVGD